MVSSSTPVETGLGRLFPGPECDLLQRHLGFLEAARFCCQLRAECERRLKDELCLLTRSLLQAEAADDASDYVQELRQGIQLLLNVVEELLASAQEGSGDFSGCEEMVLDAQALFDSAYQAAGQDGIKGIDCV
ncbi:hypothetical protein IV102_07275 [bacterium]|nr:hypothetical protein [bacterium]